MKSKGYLLIREDLNNRSHNHIRKENDTVESTVKTMDKKQEKYQHVDVS